MINGYDRWDATGEVPAILVRNSVSEQGHRVPDPRWMKLAAFVGIVASAGVAVAAGIAVAWWMVGV